MDTVSDERDVRGDLSSYDGSLRDATEQYIDDVNAVFNTELIAVTGRPGITSPGFYTREKGIEIGEAFLEGVDGLVEDEELDFEAGFAYLVHFICHEICHPAQAEAKQRWSKSSNIGDEVDTRIYPHLKMFDEAQAYRMMDGNNYTAIQDFYEPVIEEMEWNTSEEVSDDAVEQLEVHPENGSYVGFLLRNEHGGGATWEIKMTPSDRVERQGVERYEDELVASLGDRVLDQSLAVIDYGHEDVPADAIVDYMVQAQMEIDSIFHTLIEESVPVPEVTERRLVFDIEG